MSDGFRIGGPKGSSDIKGTKKTKKTGSAEGPSFASVLEQASAADETKAVEAPAGPVGVTSHILPDDQENIPQDAKERGQYVLDQLAQLEQDILSGSTTQAVQNLKTALNTSVVNREGLSAEQKQVLDEIDLRASVEIAKLEHDS